ncbi:MAG: hypothetical protein AAF871_02540 [Pseudomonadota bacterium]
MLKLLSTLGVCLFAAFAHAQPRESMRQYSAETATALVDVVTALRARMPENVVIAEGGRGAMLTYTGNALHPNLAGFLSSAFENLDPEILKPGRAMSLTMSFTDLSPGTGMSLMVLARLSPPELPLPKGGYVILDGLTGPCRGQIVLRHTAPQDKAAELYRSSLEDNGFAFEDPDPQGMSFFIGNAPDCSVGLYVQPDTTGSLIVIRYLEE